MGHQKIRRFRDLVRVPVLLLHVEELREPLVVDRLARPQVFARERRASDVVSQVEARGDRKVLLHVLQHIGVAIEPVVHGTMVEGENIGIPR